MASKCVAICLLFLAFSEKVKTAICEQHLRKGTIMGSSKSNETIQRQWEILKIIPVTGEGISTLQILDKLIVMGFGLTPSSLRTIQRDLALVWAF
jgi:hypothetical protein